FKRATFHEITKSAVMDAINHPSEIRLALVDAQQARRVLDRLVGYKVSPVLWKKVRRGLSAGRVQSVALRLIVEREREIEAFKPEEYWELDVALNAKADSIKQEIFNEGKAVEVLPQDVFVARVIEVAGKKFEPTTEADVSGLVQSLPAATYTVKQVERKERSRVSLPPFTTSTLQQAAATRLGFTSKQTMRLAQQLYEEGLITYHRTDSVNLSEQAVQQARQHIGTHYGSSYVPSSPRRFANKSKNAQEAHEAVRVTDLSIDPQGIMTTSSRFTEQHVRLYDLIWRRFVASQMNSAVYDQTTIVVEAQGTSAQSGSVNALLRSSGSVLKFDGWMKLFPAGDDTLLPAVTEGQTVSYQDLNAAQKFTQPPPRYNDASLVKELEKRGIGRPSTYASIISVLEDRAYVSRDAKRFVASPVGMTVSDFLVQHFSNFMDYAFTAGMEDDLDAIARGEREWQKVIGAFYGPLADKIKTVTEEAERAEIPVEKTGETCPKCGQGEVVLRTGKYGKFRSCSRFPDCDFSENYFEKVADVVCPLCQQGEVIIRQSRWGKQFFGCSRYPECDWADWKQPQPGARITPAEWKIRQEERAARKEARAAKNSKTKGTGSKAATTRKKKLKKKTTKK
ncbi:MAG TPA: type I DNA topoisomerase, partial [Patescibacteria group bacterium]